MRTRRRVTMAAVLAVLAFIGTLRIGAQEVKDTLFEEAQTAWQEAQQAGAPLLSPATYGTALKAYRDAEQRFDRGGNLNRVRESLARATASFRESVEKTKVAKLTLAGLIKVREDAQRAEAPRLASQLWKDAEEKFNAAARELEDGDVGRATRRGEDAERLYRDAELSAIKSLYLNETRALLAQADEARVDRYAPITLEKAKSLMIKAEKELTENRYDTDLPRSLAQQANYEIKHAIFLADYLKKVREQRLSNEQLVLDWETPLLQIAAAADKVGRLDKGYEPLADELVRYIENLRAANQSLEQDVADRDRQIADLEDEIRDLDEKLGGVSEERVMLVQRLEAQARLREQLRQVEQMFSRNEAQVFREAESVVIRLVGLNFASGQSNVVPAHQPLLQKVQNAIQVFPRASLMVEGHTDSYGSDATNQTLSEKRATAVRQYLLDNMRLNPAVISAVGYGETQPVANNETPEGRAKNRRIDIRITTSAGGL